MPNLFNQKTYVIPCLFHYSQSLIRKLKTLNFFKKKINKRTLEQFNYLDILSFMDIDNIEKQLNILKENIFDNKDK